MLSQQFQLVQRMLLSQEQRAQLERQVAAHQHSNYAIDLVLDEDIVIPNFKVNRNVLRPETVASAYLAQWLFTHRDTYQGKIVWDVGSGSGIQGIVVGLYGAREVIFSDVSESAVANTKSNAENVLHKMPYSIYQSDLFKKVPKGMRADVFIFNHPFCPKEPDKERPIERAMCDDGKLIHRFLDDVQHYWTREGPIIMPYFPLFGPTNDPGVQAPKHGYHVQRFDTLAKEGLHQGIIPIYLLTKQ